MGSTARGLITGFICRLCSKMNRYVILIYGEEGERMGLADKINSYFPITVNRHDPLPKTVCVSCVARLEKYTHMLQMITNAEDRFMSERRNLGGGGGRRSSTDNDDEEEEEEEVEEEEEIEGAEYQMDDQGGGGASGQTNETELDSSRENNNSQV